LRAQRDPLNSDREHEVPTDDLMTHT